MSDAVSALLARPSWLLPFYVFIVVGLLSFLLRFSVVFICSYDCERAVRVGLLPYVALLHT